MEKEQYFDVSELAKVLWSGKYYIIFITALSLVIGIIFFYIFPRPYQKDVILRIQSFEGSRNIPIIFEENMRVYEASNNFFLKFIKRNLIKNKIQINNVEKKYKVLSYPNHIVLKVYGINKQESDLLSSVLITTIKEVHSQLEYEKQQFIQKEVDTLELEIKKINKEISELESSIRKYPSQSGLFSVFLLSREDRISSLMNLLSNKKNQLNEFSKIVLVNEDSEGDAGDKFSHILFLKHLVISLCIGLFLSFIYIFINGARNRKN